MIVRFLISLALCLQLISCKQEKHDPLDLGFFPLGEVKEYHNFKPGSWWVFRNSLNGNLDTLILTMSTIDTFSESSELRKYTIEDLQYTISSKTTKWIYDNSPPSYTTPDAANWQWGYNMNTTKHGMGFGGVVETFFYPFRKNNGIGKFGISFQDTLKSFTLLGNTFHDVAVFFVSNDYIEDYPLRGHSAKYYWAKEVGLIYHEIRDFNDTTVILKKDELIEYKIVK